MEEGTNQKLSLSHDRLEEESADAEPAVRGSIRHLPHHLTSKPNYIPSPAVEINPSVSCQCTINHSWGTVMISKQEATRKSTELIHSATWHTAKQRCKSVYITISLSNPKAISAVFSVSGVAVYPNTDGIESVQLTTGEQRQSNQEVLFSLIITSNCGKSGDNQITLILTKINKVIRKYGKVTYLNKI